MSDYEKFFIPNWTRRFLFAVVGFLYLILFAGNLEDGNTFGWIVDILVVFIMIDQVWGMKEPWFKIQDKDV